jgi:hypothetical protein
MTTALTHPCTSASEWTPGGIASPAARRERISRSATAGASSGPARRGSAELMAMMLATTGTTLN